MLPQRPAEKALNGAEGAAPAAAQRLPCLSSNNCTELPPGIPADVLESHRKLQPNHKKTAALLGWSVKALCESKGLANIGFQTFTFEENVTDPKEAQRKWHSLRTHVLTPRGLEYIRVFERQKRGAVHYHLLVALPVDIQTGADIRAIRKGDYRTASKALRAEWAFWRKTARRYGFGRVNLQPIASTAEAIASMWLVFGFPPRKPNGNKSNA